MKFTFQRWADSVLVLFQCLVYNYFIHSFLTTKEMRTYMRQLGTNIITPEQADADIKYMKAAVAQAKKAYKLNEVPIGCVIVHEGRIIGRGYNRRNTDKTALGHAEITAIKKACKIIGDWRLEECTIYITLEPCQMCAGAIVQSRIPRVVIGSMNPKAGCAGSILNILEMPQFNHVCSVTRGVLGDVCSRMLSDFFRELRNSKK